MADLPAFIDGPIVGTFTPLAPGSSEVNGPGTLASVEQFLGGAAAEIAALVALVEEVLASAPSRDIKVITSNPYTVLAGDIGLTLRWDGTANLTLRLPNNLAEGFRVGLLQMGSGKIVPAAVSGATLIHDQGYTRTRAPGSLAGVVVGRNVTGATAEWVLGGAVGA